MHEWLSVKGKDLNSRHLAGNMFEALAGAIFLDRGFTRCKKILLRHLFSFCRLAGVGMYRNGF